MCFSLIVLFGGQKKTRMMCVNISVFYPSVSNTAMCLSNANCSNFSLNLTFFYKKKETIRQLNLIKTNTVYSVNLLKNTKVIVS